MVDTGIKNAGISDRNSPENFSLPAVRFLGDKIYAISG
jgi:hypothetical protein